MKKSECSVRDYKADYDKNSFRSLEFSNTTVNDRCVQVTREKYMQLLSKALGIRITIGTDDDSIGKTARAVSEQLAKQSRTIHSTEDSKQYIVETMLFMSQLNELLELLNQEGVRHGN